MPKDLQKYTNLLHKLSHLSSTPPYTLCIKTSILVEEGSPFRAIPRINVNGHQWFLDWSYWPIHSNHVALHVKLLSTPITWVTGRAELDTVSYSFFSCPGTQKDKRTKRQKYKKTKSQKDKGTTRPKDEKKKKKKDKRTKRQKYSWQWPKREFNIATSGQFRTFAMFFWIFP